MASLVATTATRAADVPVAGTRVQIRVKGSRAKLAFTSKDTGWTLPAASAGTPGPVQIDVLSPAHPTPLSLIVPDVAGKPGWTASINGHGAPRRYRFENPSAPDGFSTIDSIVWSGKGSFKLIVRDAVLDPREPQGGLSIRVIDATSRRCARFDVATIIKDVPGSFRARNALASALADCSAAALGEYVPPPCAMAADHSCGGPCPGDSQCTYSLETGTAACVCAGGSNLPCGDSDPVCNGFCPAGMHCGGQQPKALTSRSCGCVPDGTTACGEADYPTCGGSCAHPTWVCRPTSVKVSIFATVTGCQCSPVGGCTDGDGTPGEPQGCGPGADCPPGTICSKFQSVGGCFAQCTAP
jgi:hypothetical protein